ncbi:transmembrane protein 230 [Biomphalaria glabrata]|uniref:Transmembrane protein 230 n=1 Tax=Biomphalaria glabrata TaxID=6526 RepID=A0A2C9JS79_BIOGL|nr:transmembrane protein 230-like [Biomphalaria glabrata]KAI8769377.1 transmembrane protein 230-like [Biomphalaria glabrata]KAI8789702.1 transmembrane protein 230 [Biomphalaria glabrata]
MPRKLVDKISSKYKRLHNTVAGDGFVDIQFEKPPPKVPYRAILLATGLFVVGSVLIIVGSLLLTGYINAQYSDRTWPLLLLGSLMFIPGVYHVRIAYYAYKGYDGYSYEDIPEFD